MFRLKSNHSDSEVIDIDHGVTDDEGRSCGHRIRINKVEVTTYSDTARNSARFSSARCEELGFRAQDVTQENPAVIFTAFTTATRDFEAYGPTPRSSYHTTREEACEAGKKKAAAGGKRIIWRFGPA